LSQGAQYSEVDPGAAIAYCKRGMQGFLGENPFSAMTLIAAPAILTNAMSVLALGSGNRLGRAIDRFRELARELERSEPGTPAYARRSRRIDRFQQRAHLLLRAMQSFFTALGSFASTTIVAILGTALSATGHPGWARGVALAGLAVGTFGVLSLLFGCVMLLRDTGLAVAGLNEEAEELRARSPKT
jgi:hypothetical protein